MDKFRKIVSGLLSVSSALTLSGLGLVSTTYGAQLTDATTSLSNSKFGASSVVYTVGFHFASASSFQSIKMVFADAASSGSALPQDMALDSATLNDLTYGTDVAGDDWAMTNPSANVLLFVRTAGASTPAADDPISFVIDSIANPSSDSDCDAVVNSDSCFIRITTYANNLGTGTPIDQTTVTFTVGDEVTATATVDPILTFTVAGVTDSNITTNDTRVTVGSTVTTTATTLPFGNVTVNTAKVAQQRLNMMTNANDGYTVYGKFTGTNIMIGSASASNNIDKFTGTWGTPTAWGAAVHPTGTSASVNSGWFGVRTNDSADIAGFNTNDFYAGPDVSTDSGVGKAVMKSTTPDNGSGYTYVTFKIEANAYQPADSYTGTWRYTVVPSY